MSSVRTLASQVSMTYLSELNAVGSDVERSRMVFRWLCDDTHRPALYAELRAHEPVLKLLSCAMPAGDGTTAATASSEPRYVYLLTGTADIVRALKFASSAAYRGIGSGTFVLGVDEPAEHRTKRSFLLEALKPTFPGEIDLLAVVACHHALVGPLKTRDFDAVPDICEQAAVRFIAAYFGFPDADHALLVEALRIGFDGMIFQMFSRHFVVEPLLPTQAKGAMGRLTQRIAELIDEAGNPPGAAALFDAINLAPDEARDALARLAREIGKLETRTQAIVAQFERELDQPLLARRTAHLFDTVLNFGAVRARIGRVIRELPALCTELDTIVSALIDAKQAPESHLVPRKFLLNGELPHWQDTTSDYRFRTTFFERIAANPGANSSLDLAIMGIGAMAGLIGNVIAGSAAAIDRYFRLDAAMMDAVRKHANALTELNLAGVGAAIASAKQLEPFILEAMRLNPSAAFVPRTTTETVTFDYQGKPLPADSELIIPLGAILRDCEQPDEFIADRNTGTGFLLGDLDESLGSHRCVGGHIGMPLVSHIVRSVLSLPDLARREVDANAGGLRKKWGYVCQSLPLCYDRDQRIVQYPLNVIMTIKRPCPEHAEKLKLIIRHGAPAIEQLLMQSRIVHFARFVFLNDDTQLALFTDYDGRFDEYIRHFAIAAGPLFDLIFEHIEDAPPRPVRKHPTKFVEHIRRFDVSSAQGYFFSARPMLRVADEEP